MARKKTKPPDWWREQEPVHQDQGDGQCMLWVYARPINNPADPESWEYLLVEVPDGDGPEYGVPVLILRDGKAVQLGHGQFIQGP